MRRLFALVLWLAPSLASHAEELVQLRVSREPDRGKAAMLSLVVAAAPGLHLLDDGPLTLELEGTDLEPKARTLRRRDAVDPRAETPRFELEVRPHGSAPSVSAHLLVWVCRGPRCRPVDVTQTIPIDSKRAPGP